jgi:hypothetical protein
VGADDRTYLDATHKEDDFVMLKVKIDPSNLNLDANKPEKGSEAVFHKGVNRRAQRKQSEH